MLLFFLSWSAQHTTVYHFYLYTNNLWYSVFVIAIPWLQGILLIYTSEPRGLLVVNLFKNFVHIILSFLIHMLLTFNFHINLFALYPIEVCNLISR